MCVCVIMDHTNDYDDNNTRQKWAASYLRVNSEEEE